MTTLPTYSDYVSQVNQMIEQDQLSVEQGIILCAAFKATLSERPVHVNYLMSATGLGWKEINWMLNGLVQRGAIRKIEQKYYQV
jgi:predicted Rossmann fold nucleotide-binding protein DprA/Smf involved in DNA uptake